MNLKQLFDSGDERKEFSYKLNLCDLKLWNCIPFAKPLSISGCAENKAAVLKLAFAAEFVSSTKCSRCNSEVHTDYRLSFEHSLVKKIGSHDNRSDDIILCDSDELELDEIVISDVIPEMPMQTLCSQDCKGLCTVCGCDLNKEKCSCVQNHDFGKLGKLELLRGLSD